MNDKIILATISDEKKEKIRNITIGEYHRMLDQKDKEAKEAIAEMVYHRLYGRYIKPFSFENDQYKNYYRNGFSIMASASLLIEALESFYKGWEETKGTGDKLFDSFFDRESAFKELKGQKFHKHVRCRILHQAETTGGFTIGKNGPLYDSKKKRVNADKFLTSLQESVFTYKNKLSESEWDSEIWNNFRRKMSFIIKHCS